MCHQELEECQKSSSMECEGLFKPFYCDDCCSTIDDQCSYCHPLDHDLPAPDD